MDFFELSMRSFLVDSQATVRLELRTRSLSVTCLNQT
jgi:hypothetical protein